MVAVEREVVQQPALAAAVDALAQQADGAGGGRRVGPAGDHGGDQPGGHLRVPALGMLEGQAVAAVEAEVGAAGHPLGEGGAGGAAVAGAVVEVADEDRQPPVGGALRVAGGQRLGAGAGLGVAAVALQLDQLDARVVGSRRLRAGGCRNGNHRRQDGAGDGRVGSGGECAHRASVRGCGGAVSRGPAGRGRRCEPRRAGFTGTFAGIQRSIGWSTRCTRAPRDCNFDSIDS